MTNDPVNRLAQRWITTNYCGWYGTGGATEASDNDQPKLKAQELKAGSSSRGFMFEKYDARVVGIAGDGGEYDVQEGFGWTNGVALRLFADYGDKLISPSKCPSRVSMSTELLLWCAMNNVLTLICISSRANHTDPL